ncbi:NAD(P)/FAD-dependent oxidoreductase [Thermoanaerobacterium thermosaccharolyticum]|uniref:NAD(P)/FAD-dependent oxidoreductase n=1 Tax=Thermoanaerobacterium thermosaccharolyticum TaxID=1517 RepID=UPI00177D81CC|nr:NAD(P)/FAD-dependent oxidoreductase [Thermoanaerobacterium thermosaccharolyticum]MBE0068112.1 NAD(P)/FAD-dependent oxidoreductase [Thermoanaerobacterium thermosaccharolyticum]MBE0227855.1 NAD(P)/FAD-dependent oxidoreductase [Thermoanaerobacterium thermosaccharolyticum]
MKKVFVIGCGAAGMMAALMSSIKGNKVTIFEKNDRSGKKLLITGKGRCNVTNTATIKEFIENTPTNGKFLYSALNRFSNSDLIEFLNKNGLMTKVERGGRVFPVSDRSKDVLDVFLKLIKANGIDIHYNARVTDILSDSSRVLGIVVNGKKEYCDSIILSTGGLSYPSTGSTGDGYDMAKKLGHTIIDLHPALVPLVTAEDVSGMMGLSLKNINAKLYVNDKFIKEEFGEMLFTHFGLSGPVILTLSSYIKNINKSNVVIKLDLKPALTYEKLNDRIQRDFKKYLKKEFKNSLNDLLPRSLTPYVIKQSGINPDKKVSEVSKLERNALVHALKELVFHVISKRPIKEAIITSGGVSTKEINPKTMESRLIKGLFFAGEIIDVDALTGGYNLQISFSTGYLAGINS